MYRQIALPGRELAPYVRNFMMSGFDSLDVHLPAAPDVQLVIYLRGAAFLFDGSAFSDRVPRAFIAGPSLAPRIFRVEPGSRFIAATFRPSGFFSCFGIPANVLGHQHVPLDAFLQSAAVAALMERLEYAEGVQQFAVLETFLLQQLILNKRIPSLPAFCLDFLLSPTSVIAESLEISTRQLERRFLVHFGLPLRDYRRLARFGSALASLMRGEAHKLDLARIAQDAQYVDQAHFTRDFRQFVGDTPGRYAKSRQQGESLYHLWQLSPQELATFID